MTDNPIPTAAGWYPQPNPAERHSHVHYWDGAAWVGMDRRANRDGTRPRDTPGVIAVVLLLAGFVLSILIPTAFSFLFLGLTVSGIVLPVAELIVLAATPVAVVVSIVGLVRAHEGKYKAPLSLVALIISAVVTLLIVLPIALITSGVWAIHFG